AAACYCAGGDAFLQSGDRQACGAYWEAGKADSADGYGFVAYRKALMAAIRLYRTHDREELPRRLPLTEKERVDRLGRRAVLENEVLRENREFQRVNAKRLTPSWAQIKTDQMIAEAYHDFYLAFTAIGNSREAGICRAAEMERHRRVMRAQ